MAMDRLGDMQLFDLAVIPWPGRETGFFMGVGPIAPEWTVGFGVTVAFPKWRPW